MSHFLIPYSRNCSDAAKVSGRFLSSVVYSSPNPALQHRISALIAGRGEVGNVSKYDVIFMVWSLIPRLYTFLMSA